MGNFFIRDGQFWLNDEPVFVHAGEFHYFRTPREAWPQRLGLLKQAGFNTMATYIPWLWHQLEEDVSDFDGLSHPMRDLAGFLDLAAEMGFYIIARPGPYIMAETINEGIPPWVFENYPDSSFINQNGKVENIASYLHPDFLACVKKWYQAIFTVLTPRQITRGGKIIMVQLDNEMGMPHWVRNIFDTNPDTLDRFAGYLASTYGRDLNGRYPTDNLPTFLAESLSNPSEANSENVVTDYRRFYREYLHDYADFLWSEARDNGMEVPPIVNVHGFMNGGKTFPIGLSQLINVIEMDGMVSATDVYPLYIWEGNYHQMLFVNETTKAVQNKEQALFSVEFQSGGNNDFSSNQSSMYDLHTRLCISSGMRAINHYSFFAGENHPLLSPVFRHDWGPPVRKDGTVRHHYHRYPKLSRVLDAYGTGLVTAQPQTVTTIGYLLDHFMTEVSSAVTKEATKIITHQREDILCDMMARGLALTHRPFDMMELGRSSPDAAETPLLWVMMDKQCPAGIQQKLVDYLHQGGRLILAGRMCVQDFDHNPCTILQEALEVEIAGADPPFVSSNVSAFDYQNIPVSFVETYTGRFDEVFSTRGQDEVVGFIKAAGRGRVLMFGAAMTATTLEDIDVVNQMALKMDCQPLFNLSAWADVRMSRGEKGSFLFINNYLDDPVETIINYENETMFGGHPVRLPARRGLILPVEWWLNEDVLVHYATAEIIEVVEDGESIVLRTEPAEFTAEITTAGYGCDGAAVPDPNRPDRQKIAGTNGEIVLRKRL